MVNGGKEFKISYNTKLSDASGERAINVVSSRKIKANVGTHEKLQEKFDKIKEWERNEEVKRRRRKGEDEDEDEDEDEEEVHHDTKKEAKISFSSSSSTILFVTHLNVFLYATCFFIQTGALPYLTKTLGADPVTFGKLQTVFSVCQLVGGPLYGRMGDLLGERAALQLAFSASILTYLLTGLSTTIPVLFASRIPSILMHVMQGSQMLVTCLSSESDRAGSLARLGFSYGLGMVVGPALGGAVTSQWGQKAAALLAAAGSAVSLVLVIVFIPSVEKNVATKEKSAASVLNLSQILQQLRIPRARSLLLVKTVTGIPLGIFQSMFSVIAMEQFQLPPDQNGFLMSYIGVLSLVMQGLGVSLITTRLSDVSTIKFSALTLAVTYYALCWLKGLWDFLVLLVPLTFSLCLVNSIISSSLTKVVPAEKTGAMLGLNMAVNSVVRTLSPTVGGAMLTQYGLQSLGYLGAICNVSILVLLKFIEI